jgi:hypothetical protein
MTPADDLFSRAVIGSVVVFALLATVHFLLPARIGAALRRFHPVIGLASMSVAIACDVPVVAKVLLWLVALRYVLLRALAEILDPLMNRRFRTKLRTRAPSTSK